MRRHDALITVFTAALLFGSCATHRAPDVPTLPRVGATMVGIASWYGPGFEGLKTSSGEVFDSRLMTAAHRTWALGTIVRVTLLTTGESVVVKINDRLPRKDRVIDLSKEAARRLGFLEAGLGRVRLEVLHPAETHVLQ